MKKCEKCNEEVEVQFENCWKCGENNPNYIPYIKGSSLIKEKSLSLNERIENFKTFGIYVVLLTFVGFPLLLYFIVSNSSSTDIIYGFSFTIYLTNIILWVKLFKELD